MYSRWVRRVLWNGILEKVIEVLARLAVWLWLALNGVGSETQRARASLGGVGGKGFFCIRYQKEIWICASRHEAGGRAAAP